MCRWQKVTITKEYYIWTIFYTLGMMYAPAFDSVIKESNSLIKDALRERLKSNLLHKLPSCCYEDNEKQCDEKIEQYVNIDTESKSDSNEEVRTFIQ